MPMVASPRADYSLKPKAEAPRAAAEPRFGPSRATVEIRAGDEARVADLGRKFFGREVAPHEWASLAGAPDDSRASVVVQDWGAEAGRRVLVVWESREARAQRTLWKEGGGVVIHNDEIAVGKPYQGQGVGTRVFGRQVEQARAMGVSELKTTAVRSAEMNGYSVWPKFGYDGPIPPHGEPSAPISASLPPALASARNLSDLMRTAEGRAWWKEHGDTVKLTFDLREGSPSVHAWEGYLREKPAAPARPAAPAAPRLTPVGLAVQEAMRNAGAAEDVIDRAIAGQWTTE